MRTATSTSIAGPPARTGRLLACLELAALVVFVATRAAGHARHVDFHPTDEIFSYLAGGRALLRDGTLPDLAFSPVSCAVYAVLELLPLGALAPQDAMYWITVLAAPVALWWALRARVSGPMALAAAAWLGSSVRLLQADCIGRIATPHVYALTLALVLVALGALVRGRALAGLALLALAAVNRSELWPWVAGFGLALGATRATGWTIARRAAVAGAAVAAAIAATAIVEGVGAKAWLTFRQHYARAAFVAEHGDPRELARTDPAAAAALEHRAHEALVRPDERVARDFPTAGSVPGALRENPHAFFAHVRRNARALPASLATAQATTLLRPPALAIGLLAMLAAAAAARAGSAGPWPRPVWLLLATSPLAVVSALLVAARGELLWPLFPAWAVPVAGALSLALPALQRSPWRTASALALAAVAFAVPGPFAGPGDACQHRDVRAVLLAHPPAHGARLLCAWPTYPELIDRRDVLAFGAQHLAAALDPAVGLTGDLLVATPDLALQQPRLAATVDELVRGGAWRQLARVGVATLYAREPR